jgi:DNA (cytosine-5)-methyltransferase 1
MENKQLTLGSLFDGSGGFPLGGLLTGQITPVWSSEIEPFAIRVTTKRLPQVKHYGDVSAISGADLPPVDIITFGSPCQDMSIAGKRDGLDGSRSSLFYEAIRIVKEMRCKTNGEKPRFIVWENVPGAFSSNKGQDFKAVLEAVIGVKEPSASVPTPEKKGWPDADYYVGDGWSVAYRVFDAQWWGVPQRRKRIYLVADFADQSAPKVLFESEGMSRYSAEGFRAWQRAAAVAESGAGETGCSGAGGRLCLNDQGRELIWRM